MSQDLRFALRTLTKSPLFTLVAVIPLALGIGANTAVFSLVNALLLKPLPFHHADRLVAVHNSYPGLGLPTASTGVGDFEDYRKMKHVFEEVAAMRNTSFILSGQDRPERLRGATVSASLFRMLGVRPVIGRMFSEEEDAPERNRLVVLEEGFWQRRFGGDTRVIGRTVLLNDQPHTIVGVAAKSIGMLSTVEVYVPNGFTAAQRSPNNRGHHFLTTMAKLKIGVSIDSARRELAALGRRLQSDFPEDYTKEAGWSIVVRPLGEEVAGDSKPVLIVLLVAVGLVLLIACANVANLLLSRANERMREITIRVSLGASRWRIARQLLTESLLLGMIGGAVGLLVGMWALAWFVQSAPARLPQLNGIGLDGPVLAFTFLLSLVTSVLFGLLPALRLSPARLAEQLKEGSRSASGSLRRHKTRSTLVVAQVALSLVLLVGAGLVVQSLVRLQNVNPGFPIDSLMTFRVALPEARYATVQQTSSFIDRLVERVQQTPGVVAVGATHTLPFSGSNNSGSFEIEGRVTPKGRQSPHADIRIVTPGYFAAVGVPLKRGRLFTASDQHPVVIDERLASQYWPNEDPIGKRVNRGDETAWSTVVGVVGHVKHARLDTESNGVLYRSYLHERTPSVGFVVRTANDPRSIAAVLPAHVTALDKDLPAFEIKTMQDRIGETMSGERMGTTLLSVFALLATMMSAVGLYGLIAQTVSQRTKEIGIRMALGAEPAGVLRMIIGQGMLLVGLGVCAGVIGALALTQFMTRVLFGIRPTDPLTYVTVAVLLCVVAILATWAPARRATRINPLNALRNE